MKTARMPAPDIPRRSRFTSYDSLMIERTMTRFDYRTLQALLIIPIFMLLVGCGQGNSHSDIKVSELPANGLTPASFDHDYLQRLIHETRDAAENRLIQAYEKNRIPPSERNSHALTEGRFQQFGDQRLAVIDLSYSENSMRVTRIVGLVQDRLITISCISPLGKPVNFLSGESHCAQAVQQKFSLAR